MGYLAVVDYGAGNLMSVCKALDFLGCENRVAHIPQELEDAAGVILPGVGAFSDAMQALQESGLREPVLAAARQKPFLGICLGMQMLFESSEEMGNTPGLGLLRGTVASIPTDLKLPQIGWNSLEIVRENPLTQGLRTGDWVYFVHSYQVVPRFEEDLAAVCDYHARVPAMVARGNLFGCQFHPEKSGETGLRILRNFAGLLREENT